ncbi:MAG: hypothetical protein PHS49_05975 [Candidatus Gracilibacteria bacterium]|nr:hypothetical protein [Candidatus Gracilibacteria bacterium]
MVILEFSPENPEVVLKQRKNFLDMLMTASLNKTEFDYRNITNSSHLKIDGNVTFLYIPGEVKREKEFGTGIKYSEYLIMFTCGGNNYTIDIEVCKGEEWQEHMHGKMILSLQLVHDFDSIR